MNSNKQKTRRTILEVNISNIIHVFLDITYPQSAPVGCSAGVRRDWGSTVRFTCSICIFVWRHRMNTILNTLTRSLSLLSIAIILNKNKGFDDQQIAIVSIKYKLIYDILGKISQVRMTADTLGTGLFMAIFGRSGNKKQARDWGEFYKTPLV